RRRDPQSNGIHQPRGSSSRNRNPGGNAVGVLRFRQHPLGPCTGQPDMMKNIGEASTDAERQAEAAILSNPAWVGKAIAYGAAGEGIVSPSHRGVDARRWKVAVESAEPRYLL